MPEPSALRKPMMLCAASAPNVTPAALPGESGNPARLAVSALFRAARLGRKQVQHHVMRCLRGCGLARGARRRESREVVGLEMAVDGIDRVEDRRAGHRHRPRRVWRVGRSFLDRLQQQVVPVDDDAGGRKSRRQRADHGRADNQDSRFHDGSGAVETHLGKTMMSHGCTAVHPLTEGSARAMPWPRTIRFGDFSSGVAPMLKTAPNRAPAPGLRPPRRSAVSVNLA